MIQWMLAIWSLVPLPFLHSAWTSGSSQFMSCWSLAWKILTITLLACEINCVVVWAFFGIAFLWGWNEDWPFPVLWPLLSFPNLLAYWVQHFHSIIFQDLKELTWNSITPTSFVHVPLSLMLPKVHLTSQSRMSGSRWMMTPLWFSGSWRYFFE